MNFGRILFTRLGLLSRKVEAPDAFDLRLQRIGLRERRCDARAVLFRRLSARLAA